MNPQDLSSNPDIQHALNPNPDNLDPHDPNTVTDPVCGMLVDKRTALNTMAAPVNASDMQTLYFCSEECKIIFEQSPEDYGFNL